MDIFKQLDLDVVVCPLKGHILLRTVQSAALLARIKSPLISAQ